MKKLGPTKLCFILHGIGSTTTTDQGECGFLIVSLFVFPLCALKQVAKSVIFCKGPDLQNEKIGSDKTLFYSPWDW